MQLNMISLHADYNSALEKHETTSPKLSAFCAIIFMVIDPEEV